MIWGDSFMMLVVVAVLLSPFLPLMLKTKCPICSKRKLEHLETVKNSEDAGKKKFTTFYRCHHCNSHFQQEMSGPLQKIEPVEEPSEGDLESLSA